MYRLQDPWVTHWPFETNLALALNSVGRRTAEHELYHHLGLLHPVGPLAAFPMHTELCGATAAATGPGSHEVPSSWLAQLSRPVHWVHVAACGMRHA